MRLFKLQGPAQKSMAMQILTHPAVRASWNQMIKTVAQKYPDATYKDLAVAIQKKSQKLSGWLSDLGSVVSSAVGTVGDAAGSIIGDDNLGNSIRSGLDSAGHGLESAVTDAPLGSDDAQSQAFLDAIAANQGTTTGTTKIIWVVAIVGALGAAIYFIRKKK